MKTDAQYDAFVVGSGPNGLAAAITLARAGLSVKLLEAKQSIGGGVRSAELTLPGFLHDVCSSVYPIAAANSFFRSLPKEYTPEWIVPQAAMAHPLDDGTAVVLLNDLLRNEALGSDAEKWAKIFTPFVHAGESFIDDLLNPIGVIPKHPLLMARFGIKALQSAQMFANTHFTSAGTKALFAGIAGHSLLRLDQPLSAASTLVLALAAHVVGWPLMKGGAQALTKKLAAYFQSLGGAIQVDTHIDSIDALPSGKLILLDIGAKNLPTILGAHASSSYKQKLEKFRMGPGILKMDWALSSAVPWRAKECLQAATIHIGGTFEEIAASEAAVANGTVSEAPYVLAVQPTIFDPTRCPEGKHIFWAYCHVPAGWKHDISDRIENQIERFAPGFKDCILARNIMTPLDFESYNPNYIGGDISGGAMDWPQVFARPVNVFNPYKTPMKNVYLCSASTPPGPGVHGMCGVHAAKLALKEYQREIIHP